MNSQRLYPSASKSEKAFRPASETEGTTHDIKRLYQSLFGERVDFNPVTKANLTLPTGIRNVAFSRLTRLDRFELMAIDPATIGLIIEGATLLVKLFKGDNGSVAADIKNIGIWV